MAGSENLFEQAVAAAQQRDFPTARMLLKQLFKQDPQNVNAWLLGARVVESNADAIRCYERVLQIDPNHAYAKQKLAELRASTPATPAFSSTPIQPVSPGASNIEPQAENAQLTPVSNEVKTNRQVIFALIGIVAGICCLAVLIIAALPSMGFSTAAQPTPTNQELFNVLYRNGRASNTENIDEYMATIHTGSFAYLTTRALLEGIFSTYDLSYRFYNLRVISVDSNEAKVHFSLETKRISGPAFRNNIISGTMILKPDNGVWKIYSQEVEETE